MPLIDMPLAELRLYKGINPRPADHDAYWDRGLAALGGVDPHVELVPHAMNAPFAECFDLYFTGVGGARVHAKYLRPKQARGRHPAALLFHGYYGNSGDWSDKLKWPALGFSVAALDVRGQGGPPRTRAASREQRCAATSSAAWTVARRASLSPDLP